MSEPRAAWGGWEWALAFRTGLSLLARGREAGALHWPILLASTPAEPALCSWGLFPICQPHFPPAWRARLWRLVLENEDSG